jgi:glycyl-tRNA synthetase beta chain
MAEFLLELYCEEIPARMQARAAEDLKALIEKGLKDAGLAFARLDAHVTPRRLALVADGLPVKQPDVVEERKGPKVDAPQPAIDGFLRSTGLTLDQCEQRDTPKGPVWFAVVRRPGRPTAEVLAEIVGSAIGAFVWPKSMRWGESGFRWVRPLHHVLALFDGKVLPGGLDLNGGVRFDFTDETRGHRFLAPAPVRVTSFDDYREKLARASVVLDREERKRLIVQEISRLAAAEGLRLKEDPGLLEEVAGLVEYPVVLLGRIDDSFMSLPAEVLTTSMRTHQKYFALERADGSLAPRFAVVANTTTRDGGATVVAGNEKVLRARLSDARFFWDQDRKVPLADRVAALGKITFHEKLGTMAEKVDRMIALVGDLADLGGDSDRATRAALLAKADLVTGMVGEFPELQGLMGGYYAAAQGEDEAVVQAIAEHYRPAGPNDRCPSAPLAVRVALADKLDTLVGFFAIDEKPTGSRDPFALRRAALGIIRLIRENGHRVPLGRLVGAAHQLYLTQGRKLQPRETVQADLMAFFADRLKVALREQGVRHDLIDAVFALGGEDDLVRLLARVEALTGFLGTDDGANLLTAYRRAGNIVRIEAKKDGIEEYGEVDAARLDAPEEQALHAALEAVRAELQPLLGAERFADAMGVLAGLRAPVDAFFDRVTVNADDPALRTNRLALLSRIVGTMNSVADFSHVEG